MRLAAPGAFQRRDLQLVSQPGSTGLGVATRS